MTGIYGIITETRLNFFLLCFGFRISIFEFPEGIVDTDYILLNANDGCYYDSDGNGSRDANGQLSGR